MSQGTLTPRLTPRRLETSAMRIPRWMSFGIWGLFLASWLALLVFRIGEPDTLGQVWNWIRDLPIVVEIAVWIGFLPIVLALAAWNTGWALWIRLGVLALCVIWSTLGLYPGRNRASVERSSE